MKITPASLSGLDRKQPRIVLGKGKIGINRSLMSVLKLEPDGYISFENRGTEEKPEFYVSKGTEIDGFPLTNSKGYFRLYHADLLYYLRKVLNVAMGDIEKQFTPTETVSIPVSRVEDNGAYFLMFKSATPYNSSHG